MNNETKRYLDLIGEHLREHHASVLVGAGFSRNAIKIDDSVPDSPTWEELGSIFISKLTDDPDEKEKLAKLSPLVLAERVEAIYGRSELDHILLSSIRNADFRPSSLHYKFLKLPWSDIFTTNYDTLLEDASRELTEQIFTIVTCKEDLIGSSGTNRIIKLHGSFPSQRPFVISSEDYRTYPQMFAPFVNTVQQSMLENTLCLIGFSGDDPNFEKWTGWIRDNLGVDNAPNIYLLLHYAPSEAEKKLLFRRKIIPVDLSQLTDNRDVSTIYETTLDYLLAKQRNEEPDRWNLNYTFRNKNGAIIPIQEALEILREIHISYPGWVTVPTGKLSLLRSIAHEARTVLSALCNTEHHKSDIALEYLYEYDWLREKTLLPPFTPELKLYQVILEQHPESSYYKYAIQLSLMRDLRESGEWAEWESLHDEIKRHEIPLNIDQFHRLCWEECLYALAQYRYQELVQRLNEWSVEPSMSIWALRKAGLLAECGHLSTAHDILQSAILNIRRRLSHQSKINLALLSIESSMMVLQGFVNQALDYTRNRVNKEEQKTDDTELADRRHRALHDQYHVDWDRQNNAFETWLEAPWTPFRVSQTRSSFDFGGVHRSSHFSEDKEAIHAYSFLRFREETGIPYFINSVHAGTKAACGAAERIALYSPIWSIQVLVRTDAAKEVERVITRSLLSSWSQEEADIWCQFYCDALLRTEDELSFDDWFFRRNFVRLAADVLPELLSELCSKCSLSVLSQLLAVLKKLYCSEKKMCYTRAPSLARRLIAAYPRVLYQKLACELLTFPIITNELEGREFKDPFSYLSHTASAVTQDSDKSFPEVEKYFVQYKDADDSGKESVLNRLMYCLYAGLLTQEEKICLRDLLWIDQQFCGSKWWLRTISLDLPAPENIDVPQYLAQVLVKELSGYTGKGERPNNDIAILRDIQKLIVTAPGVLTGEQISVVLSAFCARLRSLSSNLDEKWDALGLGESSSKQMYQIAHILWLLVGTYREWTPSEDDLQFLRCLSEILAKSGIRHCGFHDVCCRRLDISFDMATELSKCFRTAEEEDARWGFEVLAFGIRRPELTLLEDSAMRTGLDTCAQQIAWGVPKLLAFALQALTLATIYKPELISCNALEAILSGLSQMEKQTKIGVEDTIESACTKGHVRENAAALARALNRAKLCGDRPEILVKWMDIIRDKDEFAEIRNAGNQY